MKHNRALQGNDTHELLHSCIHYKIQNQHVIRILEAQDNHSSFLLKLNTIHQILTPAISTTPDPVAHLQIGAV